MNGTAPKRCDVLVVDGLVITLDAADNIIPDGAIAISNRRIVDIGPSAQVMAKWSPAKTVSARDRVVMPGLINIHNHTPLMITRGMIEDLGFAPMFTPGIPQGHRLSYEDASALARLGVYELLRTGSTTIVDFYRYPQALAEAHARIGTRAIVAGRVHDADPEELTRKRYVYSAALGAESIAENVALIERWNGFDEGRIRCDFAPHAPDTCSMDALREVARLVEAHGGNVHTHLCQSTVEVAQIRARDDRSPVETMAEAGLLNERLIAAHCIHVDERDITALGASGATMAYTPIGNAKTGRIAPANAIARAGARLALCTDTFSGDMFEAMRWAVSMQRIRGDAEGLSARAALRWATQNGADALGLGDQIGSLEIGKRADIVLLDRAEPTFAPIIDGFGALVWSGNGSNVHTVLVDGRVILEDRRLTLADGDAIVRDAQAVAERLWSSSGRQPVSWQQAQVA